VSKTPHPQAAPVRPRVVSPRTGETLLLEDWVEPFLRDGEPGAICFYGQPGSGKSTALAHLAARAPRPAVAVFLDEPDAETVEELRDHLTVVYTAVKPHALPHRETAPLALWGAGERLEFLMAVHPARCASVMKRVAATLELEGGLENAALWRICLDRMAADESISSLTAALEGHFKAFFRWGQRGHARRVSLAAALGRTGMADVMEGLSGLRALLAWFASPLDADQKRFLRHGSVRLLLAADELSRELRNRRRLRCLEAPLPRTLLAEAGRRLSGDPKALARLERRLEDFEACHPMVASLLHASGSDWTPERTGTRFLKGGSFPGARWTALRLAGVNLDGADLSDTVLTEASLERLSIAGAILRGARLYGSRFRGLDAREADLSGADLSHAMARWARFVHADLSRACLRRADLAGAKFFGARIDGADFSGANLTSASLSGLDLRRASWEGARFAMADLHECNLEGMRLPGARFKRADLSRALLTGSFMPAAEFTRARLRGARLAEVEWPYADLIDADLRSATFHMGSSRSGLVFASPMEGSRTGFYTDEYYDQSYRVPKEIRKANLRGADLRGAKVFETDFYLVDLRGAHYTPDQEAHFRRCGAILSVRV